MALIGSGASASPWGWHLCPQMLCLSSSCSPAPCPHCLPWEPSAPRGPPGAVSATVGRQSGAHTPGLCIWEPPGGAVLEDVAHRLACRPPTPPGLSQAPPRA